MKNLITRWRAQAASSPITGGQTYTSGHRDGLNQAANELEAELSHARLGAMAIRHLLTGECDEVLECSVEELEMAALKLEGVDGLW